MSTGKRRGESSSIDFAAGLAWRRCRLVTRWCRGHFNGAKARRELAYAPSLSYEEAMAETKGYLVELGIIEG